MNLYKASQINFEHPLIIVILLNEDGRYQADFPISIQAEEQIFIQKYLDKKIFLFRLPRLEEQIFIHFVEYEEKDYRQTEKFRIAGSSIKKTIGKHEFKFVDIWSNQQDFLLAYAEGLLLKAYDFSTYKSDDVKEWATTVYLVNSQITETMVAQLSILLEATYFARDLVNIPGSDLTAVELSKRFEQAGSEAGFKVEVFNKAKIEALKMGGLLAVNRGSLHPPTFSIMEWKPEHARNSSPVVLVGKGIVFDTGGLSLKPTMNSMDHMKCDMAGAAVVAGVMYAIAKSKLDIHVIALVPSTDNRPGQDAYYPGDVVRMYDGSTVEVLNTDAEGRMILADALSYAKKYKPELTIDIATLTGSSAMAIGKYGLVSFATQESDQHQLQRSGDNVYERVVGFPLWDEYAELLKSDVADVKNIGGREAGAITAAKFLERFTDYNWIHLDIAGPAFIQSDYKYFTKGGTAFGLRLLVDFLKNLKTDEKEK
jgi:leucyl aminopeptidase